MLDRLNEVLESLKGLKVDTEGWDPILIHILTSKLCKETRAKWETNLSSRERPTELPKLKEFKDFLENRFRTLEAIQTSQGTPRRIESHHIQKGYPKQNQSNNNWNKSNCPSCKRNHMLKECSQFLNMTTKAKHDFIKQQKRCFNCFSLKHLTKDCPQTQNCRKCGKRHNTLLHFDNNSTPKDFDINHLQNLSLNQQAHVASIDNRHIEELNGERSSEFQVNNTFVNQSTSKTVLLATALVNVYSDKTGYITLRALLDQGSQASFITERASQLLGLKRNPTDATVTGIGSTKSASGLYAVNFKLKPHFESNRCFYVQAFVIKTITGIMPPYKIENKLDWQHLVGLQLADPLCLCPGEIDLLLGADIYASLLDNDLRRGPIGSPVAQKTFLGWILSGPIEQRSVNSLVVKMSNDDHVNDILQQFWKVEEVEIKSHSSPEEELCENIFVHTCTRNEDGRYVVNLPFKNHPKGPDLGESKNMALKRFFNMERKLEMNPELKGEYVKFMQEYEQLGHMERVYCESECAIKPNYLPHHAVIKADSSTTKTRVVFDASAKTSNQKSLNDTLLVGRTIQQDLSAILLRWRKHKIAFTADIEKMYRQILISPSHTDYQRILWRNTTKEPVKEYRLLTVTYGTASAPFLAIRTLNQLSIDEQKISMEASNVIRRDFYVDDLLSGADSIPEAIQLQQEIRQILLKGKLKLRKWTSNEQKVLKTIPLEDIELKESNEIQINETIKALGILWNPFQDSFKFKVKTIQHEIKTKRNLLSEIAKLFDPLGFLSPIIIVAKIIMQQLWLSGIHWDEEVPPRILQQWKEFQSQLKCIEEISIPRWIHYTNECTLYEMHGFCDASTHAYAAVVYLRVETNSKVFVTLLAAKTKVAPIKQISLPRLELCAAVLLSKLIKRVQNDIEIKLNNIYLWTDSSIVLAWLQGHPSRWKTFVANRTSEILQNTSNAQFRHICTKENPADCASRGITPKELKDHSLWWFGPKWLRKEKSNWPKTLSDIPETKIELKRSFVLNVINCSEQNELLDRFSTLEKLVRFTAICYRFLKNCKTKADLRYKGHISKYELKDALYALIRIVQNMKFQKEIKHLKSHQPLDSKSRLLNLNPFVDNDNILRVGGRLRHSNLSYDQKFPIILPEKSSLTKLIINDVHKISLHGGVQLMMTYIRKKYWIINARNAIKFEIHRCVTCYRHKSRTQSQLMGDLPEYRVKVSRPFLHTGVDFSGPLLIRESKCRGRIKTSKGYLCIFICLATRAIHLEAVSDMSTDAFLAAFRRFCSRRGLCTDIYSDCGTNFVGANKKLSEFRLQSQWGLSNEVFRILANKGVEWHFIPPASPHFGGLWESGVKSAKYHLKRIMGNLMWTFEELSTCLSQIEACLNSRPLCPLSDDPEDNCALTPGHFLIGDAIIAPPDQNILDHNISVLSRWKLIQKVYQDFWKRWSTEYLSRLQQRPKWLQKQSNVRKGNLVLIKDERLPPTRWLLGRVVDTFPGADGLVRVVAVKIKDSILKRPITKICLLPIKDNTEITN